MSGWKLAVSVLAALILAGEIYGPAMAGVFVLDDLYLPFAHANASTMPVGAWLAGQRPVLMLSYWINYGMSGVNPSAYHWTNVLLHVVNAGFVFAILRRLTRNELISALAAGIFLVHPIQTEAVAYVAGRSDVLSALFSLAAYLMFLRIREAGATWAGIAPVAVLFVCAVLCKEQAAVLPGALLLTDFWLGGIAAVRVNARLHGLFVVLGAAGGAFVAWRLSLADTAGLGLAGLGPMDYFFTQCRVVWHYLKLVVLPLGLNIDTDFAISRSLFDQGSIIGLVAILALIAGAWRIRPKHPLVGLSLLLFLLWLAPTSSFMPIRDVVAERRVYLPLAGLLLAAAGYLARSAVSKEVLLAGGGVAMLVLSVLTYGRAEAWGDDIKLWEETVRESPRKWRPRFQLADAYFQSRRFAEANREFAKAAEIDGSDVRLLVNWGLSLDAAGDTNGALVKFEQAVKRESTAHTQSLVGMANGKLGRYDEALKALDAGGKLDPNFAPIYVNRGNVYASHGNWVEAVPQYKTALRLDPNNEGARHGLRQGLQNGVQ